MFQACEQGHKNAVKQLMYADLMYSSLNTEAIPNVTYYIDGEDEIMRSVFNIAKEELDVEADLCEGGIFEAVNKCQTKEGKTKIHVVLLKEIDMDKGINIESLRKMIDQNIPNIKCVVLLTSHLLDNGSSEYLPVFAQKKGIQMKNPYTLYYLVNLAEGWGRLQNNPRTLETKVTQAIYNNWLKNMDKKMEEDRLREEVAKGLAEATPIPWHIKLSKWLKGENERSN